MHQLKFNRTLNDSSRPGVCGCDLISQSVALTHHLILNFWCTELWGVFRLSPSCFRGLRKARTKSQIQTYHGKFPDQKIIVKIDGVFLRPNITCLWLFKYQPTNYPPYCSRIKLVDASTGSFEVEMLKHRRRAIVIHYFDFTLHTLHSIFLTFELKAPPPKCSLSLAPVWFILCQCPRLFGSNTASIGSLFALMIFNNWLKASRRDDILK